MLVSSVSVDSSFVTLDSKFILFICFSLACITGVVTKLRSS